MSDEREPSPLIQALDSIASRRIILFGGKGGVGKTTISVAAAVHYAQTRPTILFTTDPASSLGDLLAEPVPGLTIESLDASALYSRFLGANLESFIEIGDRGTYLDRDELRGLFELAVPGIDELMAWMRMGELAEEHPQSLIVVDTAPTGHTRRMLASSDHFRQIAVALDAMEEKHRAMVRQFTRRNTRDAIDAFISDFDAQSERRTAVLRDPARAVFVPVTLAEPLVVEQTLRLIEEVGGEIDMDVPFVVLNRAHAHCRASEDAAAREKFAPRHTVDAPRACAPLDSAERIVRWSSSSDDLPSIVPPAAVTRPSAALAGIVDTPLLFLAGKGGVGKTTCSSSIALQLASRNPQKKYVAISVDPAHSLRDLFATIAIPPNLTVEAIDTREKWARFRETFGARIEDAVDSLTPRGMSLGTDAEAMRQLVEIAPPGADELFAITRLSDLAEDESVAGVVVDTAPTGHFLRLLDLPTEAAEWVREFMRLLLKYRDLIPAGSLGEELVRASRALKALQAALASERTSVIVVTRPERIVVAETKRLMGELTRRNIRLGGVIANYVTPESSCPCDLAMRSFELEALREFDAPVVIERRETPPATADELMSVVPLESS